MSDAVRVNATDRRVMLWGEVNAKSMLAVADGLFSIKDDKTKPIRMVINSGGGGLESAFGLIDIMQKIKSPIQTIGVGMVGSAALIIFMAGKQRLLSKNSVVLSHEYSSNHGWQSHSEWIETRQYQDWTMERIVKHYMRYTGKTEKFIKDNLLRQADTWIKPTDAKKFGLCDKLID